MAARDFADDPTPVPGAGFPQAPPPGRVLGGMLDPAALNPRGLIARGADADVVSDEEAAATISSTIAARPAGTPDGTPGGPLADLVPEPVIGPVPDDGESLGAESFYGDPRDFEGDSVLDDVLSLNGADDDPDADDSADQLADENATFLSTLGGEEGEPPPFPTMRVDAPDGGSGVTVLSSPPADAEPDRPDAGSDATFLSHPPGVHPPGVHPPGVHPPGTGGPEPVGNFADDDSLAGASSGGVSGGGLSGAGDEADEPTGHMSAASGAADESDEPTGEMSDAGDAPDEPTDEMSDAAGDVSDEPTGEMSDIAGGASGAGASGGTQGAGLTAGGGRTAGGRVPTAGGTGASTDDDPAAGGSSAAGSAAGRSAGASAAGASAAGASASPSLTGGAAHISAAVPTRQIAPDLNRASSRSDYAVLAALGEGGMGVVSRAEQRSLGRDVALKQVKGRVNARQRARLATEAIVTGELEHPNIVPVYDLGRDDGGDLFYSMRVIGGTGWHKALKLAPGEEGALTEEEHLDVWLKVADAVAFAHSRGVINYDLKPENVQLDGFGQVLVLDWGLAHVTDRFDRPEQVADNQRGGGSPAYMAPEQGHNQLASMRLIDEPDVPVTAAVDVYLLGAMLWEVATGSRPHTGDPEVAEGIARRAGRPKAVRLDKTLACCVAARENVLAPTDRDDELIEVARRAMATDPADRYESVEALQAAVREYRAHGQSRRLTARGAELVAAGELARGAAAFDDAVELWPANDEAKTLATDTQRRLDRRKRATRSLALSLALVTLIGFGAVSFTGYRQYLAQQKEAEARRQETIARKEAEAAKDDLIAARDEIVRERDAAIAAKARAEEAEQLAVAEQKRAERLAVAEREAKDAAEEATRKALAAAEEETKAKLAADRARLDEATAKERAIAERKKAEAAAEAARIAEAAAKKSATEEAKAKLAAVEEQKKAEAAATAAQRAEAAAKKSAEEEMKAKVAAVAEQKKAEAAAEAARVAEAAARKSAMEEAKAKLAAVAEQKKAEAAAKAAQLAEAAAKKSAEEETKAKLAAVEEQKKAVAAAEAERRAKLAAIAARRVSEHRSYVSLVRAADDRRRDDLGGARTALATLDRAAPGDALPSDALAAEAAGAQTPASAAPTEPEGFEVRYLRAALARSNDSVAADDAGPAPDLTGVAALPAGSSNGRPRFAVARAGGAIRLDPATPGGDPLILRDPLLVRLRGLAAGEGPDGPLLAAVGDGRRGDRLSVALWDLNDAAREAANGAGNSDQPIEPTRRLGALRPASALRGVRIGRGPAGPLVLAWGEEGPGGEGLERDRPRGVLLGFSPTATNAEPALRIGLSGDDRPLDADLSADGTRLAAVVSAGAGGAVRLWELGPAKGSGDRDALTAANRGAFRGHTTFRIGEDGAVTAGATRVRFAPDGPWGPRRVVSGGTEGRVLIWNADDVVAEAGGPPRDLPGRPGTTPRPLRAIDMLAVWAHHDGSRGLPVRALGVLKTPAPTDAEADVALLVASAGDDARVRLWRTGTGSGAGRFAPLVWTEDNAADPAGTLARQSPATLEFARPPIALELAALDRRGGYELLAVGPRGEADRLTNATRSGATRPGGGPGAAVASGSSGSSSSNGADGEVLALGRPITAVRTAPGRPGAAAAASAGGAIRLVTETGRVGVYEEGTLQSSRDTYAALSPAGVGLDNAGARTGRRLAATTSAGAVLLWDVDRRGLIRRFTPKRELGTASRRAPLPAVAAAVAEVDAALAEEMSAELDAPVRAGSVVLAYAAGDRTVAVLRWPRDGAPVPVRTIELDAAPTALGFTGDVSALVIGTEDGRLWAADALTPVQVDAADGRTNNPAGPATPLGRPGDGRIPPLVVEPLPGAAVLVGTKRLIRVDLSGLNLAAAARDNAAGKDAAAVGETLGGVALTHRYQVANPIVSQSAVWPAGAFGAAAGFAVIEQTGKQSRDLVIFREDQAAPLARLPLGSRAFSVAAAPDPLRPRLTVTVGSGANETVRVLEVGPDGTPRSLASLPTKVAGGSVSAAAFSADGAVLLLSTPAGVAVWDPAKDAPEDGRLGGGTGDTRLAFDPAGEFLLTGDASGSFQLLRAEPEPGGELPALLKRSVPPIPGSTDGGAANEDGVRAPVSAVAVRGAGGAPPETPRTLLVAAGRRAWLYEYDPAGDPTADDADEAGENGKAGGALSAPRALGGDFAAHAATITAALFVPSPGDADRRWALTADSNGSVRLWDAANPDRALAEVFAKAGGAGLTVRDLAVPAAGPLPVLPADGRAGDEAPAAPRLVLAAATDAGPFVWSLAPPVDPARPWGSIRVALRGRGGAARGVAFAPDRPDRLVSAGADGTAQIWDWNGSAVGWDPLPGPEVMDGSEREGEISESLLALDRPRGGHEGGLTAVAVDPDGSAVLTGGEDGRVLRWSAPASPAARVAAGR